MEPAGSYRYDPAVLTSGYSRYFHEPLMVKANTSPVCLWRGMVTPGCARTRTTQSPASMSACRSWKSTPSMNGTNGSSSSLRCSELGTLGIAIGLVLTRHLLHEEVRCRAAATRSN